MILDKSYVVVSLSSARLEALRSIRKAQKHYKSQYDKKVELKLGDWVLVYFPKDEAGRNRKLSKRYLMQGKLSSGKQHPS